MSSGVKIPEMDGPDIVKDSIFTNINVARAVLLVITLVIIIFGLIPFKFFCDDEDGNDEGQKDEDQKDQDENINNTNKGNSKCTGFSNTIYFSTAITLITVIVITLVGIYNVEIEDGKSPIGTRKSTVFEIIMRGFKYFFKNFFKGKIDLGLPTKVLGGIAAFFLVFIPVVSYFKITAVLKWVFLVGALALVYLLTKGTITNKFLTLIANVVFYIPCLFIDLFEYLHRQYKISTRVEWSILAFEIVVVAVYYLLPKVSTFFINKNSMLLQNKPLYTNQKHSIANKDSLTKVYAPFMYKTPSSEVHHKYNYAISLWSYINPQPPNTNSSYETFTPIFSYERKPEILYKGDTNELLIRMENKNNETINIFEMKDVPLQKWNHIVINYFGGTLDVFFNNKLVASEINVSPYMDNDEITIGSFNGVHGGICNVKYFKKPLSKYEIYSMYNSKKSQNPPIN